MRTPSPVTRNQPRIARPLPDMVALASLVAFWDERVDVFLDGEPRGRPRGAFVDALRDEFGR